MPIVLPAALPGPALDPAAGPDLTRYVLVCAGLLALVLGLAWVFRRFFADSLRRRAARRSLSIADVLPLGRRQKLIVVRCYDRSFLLGLGEKEVRAIAELDVDELAPAAAPAGEAVTPHEPDLPFRAQLTRAVEQPVRVGRSAVRPAGWENGRGILG